MLSDRSPALSILMAFLAATVWAVVLLTHDAWNALGATALTVAAIIAVVRWRRSRPNGSAT